VADENQQDANQVRQELQEVKQRGELALKVILGIASDAEPSIAGPFGYAQSNTATSSK
jgi:hypothetical protein